TIRIGPRGKDDVGMKLIKGAVERWLDRSLKKMTIKPAENFGCVPIARVIDRQSIVNDLSSGRQHAGLPPASRPLVGPEYGRDDPHVVQFSQQAKLMAVIGRAVRLKRAGIQVSNGQD